MSTKIKRNPIGNGSSPPSTDSLTDEEIHMVLSNGRRREVIEQLRTNGDGMTARELAERIAEIESGETPAPRKKRQSAYVSLHQTHLPKLEHLGIVDYDTQSKQVRLREPVEHVTRVMDTTSPHPSSRPELQFGIGVLGLLMVLGADADLPGLGALPPHYWAYVILSIVIALTGSHAIQRRAALARPLGRWIPSKG